MNAYGAIALVLAAGAAGWLLWRAGRGAAGADGRNVTLLKLAVWLGLAGVLFAAKLFPLALMILLAAGGVTAIELWRARMAKAMDADEAAAEAALRARPRGGRLSPVEAASVLGVGEGADPAEIRAAHKRLISQMHPDKGGSDYLAAKVNDARKVLLEAAAASPAASIVEDSGQPGGDGGEEGEREKRNHL